MTRTKNAFYNIISVWIGQALIVAGNLISRRIFLHTLGSEYLGINSLFANVLSILSMADLGIGNAINYCLYKPLAEKDFESVKSLMRLYRKVYTIIGIVILAIGIVTAPNIQMLITGAQRITNPQIIYLLFIINTSISYFFSYYSALIIADQKKYIFNFFHYFFQLIMYTLQILVLVFCKNFYAYLMCQILTTLLENVCIAYVAKRKYPYLAGEKIRPLNKSTIQNIKENVKSLILNKIGTPLVTSTDNILISKIINISTVGIYANYSTIVTAVSNVFWQAITSLTASVGNQLVTTSKKESTRTFHSIVLLGSWLYGWGAVGLYVLLTPFIELWYGNYQLSQSIVGILCLSSYISGQRTVLLSYIDAAGLYYRIPYKSIIEGIVNLVVSIILGEWIGLAGIFIGTIVSGIFCGWIVELRVVVKELLNDNIWKYLVKQVLFGGDIVLSIIVISTIMKLVAPSSLIINFLFSLFFVAVIPNLLNLLFLSRSNDFKFLISRAKLALKKTKQKN